MTNQRVKLILALVAAVLTFITGWFVAPAGDDTDRPPGTTAAVTPTTTTHELGGVRDDEINVPPEAQAIAATEAVQAKAGLESKSEFGLHETKQPSRETIDIVQGRAPPGSPPIPVNVPLASTEPPDGCVSATVRNYSARPPGARVLLGVIHWTGSAPTLGSPAGGLAIVRWFDSLASRASSSEVTDQDGRCWMTVPEAYKPWTQVAANPWSVSVEITNIGTAFPLFQTKAARDAVVRLMVGWHDRWGLPFRHAKVDGNCVPIVSGFLDHKDLGPCGGGHPDVDGFDLNGLIREAARVSAAATRPTGKNGQRCRALAYHRAKIRAGAHYRDKLIVRSHHTTRGKRMRYLRVALQRAGVDQRHACH